MADSSSNSGGNSPTATAPSTGPAPTTQDIQNLGAIITEWRRIQDEIVQLRQAASEKSKQVKVLETIIMNIMKQKNIGALDLKSSGARILYEKKANKAGINKKSLQKMLLEHFKDDKKAAEVFKYIQEHRGEKTKEKLAYEKL